VLIPFDCDDFSRRALYTLLDNLQEIRADHNAGLQLEGIVVNQYQAQAKLPREVVQQLKDEGLPVLDSMLPPSVLMKESHHKNQPLIHLAADHKLTQAYQSLFNEIEQK
jgi:chromosome partitioning protein